MTSLEFIEQELDAYKQLRESAILRIADENDEIELYMLQRRIDMLNKRIPILQQIKNELEVLKILKPQLDLEYEDGEDDKFMIGMRHYVGLETEQVKIVKEVMRND